MKPLYWVLIGVGVVAFGALKLFFVQKWMTKRQADAERRRAVDE